MTALLEQLGVPGDARLLIVTCEGLGVSHAANAGVYSALRVGIGTTAGVMMPSPWARHAAANHLPGDDIGVQLTLNAEHELYRWGPLTLAPSLLDGDGGLPRTTSDLWDHADVEEVRRECRAQLERATQWGFDVTHLGSHLHALALRPEFFDVYVELAVDHGLPVRLPPAAKERLAGFPYRRLAAEEGVLCADHVLYARSRPQLVAKLADLPAGVTELVLHPAVDSPELRAYAPDWPGQVEDHLLATSDAQVNELLGGARRIGYAALRDAQRA
ncbi:MAG: ChbG/HpnK family deacetylase [Acidimicrobiia bacterium]|nr:ChbG/HpnK family deacetylase [Acidimicrobiia bacterium]